MEESEAQRTLVDGFSIKWGRAIAGGRERSQVEGAIAGGNERSRRKVAIVGGGGVEGSDHWWKGAIAGGGERSPERSQVEGSGLRWWGVIAGRGERSLVEGSGG